MAKPVWETVLYKKKIKKYRDQNLLCCGMQEKDGTFNYDPFSTPNIDDFYFDFDESERYVSFIEDCVPMFTSSYGTDEGDYMKLLDWQKRPVLNVFGWKRKDTGYRRYKDVNVYIPRKNGKSCFLGAIIIAFMKLEKEGGMQAISGANSKDQAKMVFDFVKNAVQMDDYLREYFKTYRGAVTANYDRDSYRPISADAGIMDGLNVNFAAMDETHEYKNEELPNVIKTSQGARKQPLYVEITTAAAQGVNYCNARFEYSKKVSTGEWLDDTHLPVLFYLTEEDDWEDQENWLKVNPSLHLTKSLDYMVERYEEAKKQPYMYENNFKRKELNIVTASQNKFIDLGEFQLLQVSKPELHNTPCYAGLDLAYKSDMCALVLEFPDFNNFLLPFFWMPKEHPHIEHFWRFKDYITFTEGNVIDFARVKNDILSLNKKYKILGLAYDPFAATELIQNIGYSINNVYEVSQSVRNMNEPLKAIASGVQEGIFGHDGNKCFEWMIGNGEIKTNAEGFIKLEKPQGQNATINKIDGLVAWALAHYLSVNDKNNMSIYNDRAKNNEEYF